MGVKVNLPPGCYGFEARDGTKYTAKRPGGSVEVSDKHASHINKGEYASQGFISAKQATSFGTRAGRWCQRCNRLWNAWNKTCQKCGDETILEE